MNRFITILFLIFLAGCATVSPSYTYRPANYNGPGWNISARADEGILKDTISITINGEHVVGGSLHELKKKDNFTGKYQDRNVLAECSLTKGNGFSYGHECTVFVDNERVAYLTF